MRACVAASNRSRTMTLPMMVPLQPPNACSTRAAISTCTSLVKVQTMLASTKMPVPASSTGRRP